MAKLSKKVKIRNQRETLLISIPKAIAEMMHFEKGGTAIVTYNNGKMTVEVAKEDDR